MSLAAEFVNPIAAEDVSAWARAVATTFLGDPDGPQTARRIDLLRRGWDPARAWGVRDRGRWVGTLRTEARTLSVPGVSDGTRDVRVDAVTSVTVPGTHRRQGLMSVLIAAEWPIYRRHGYAPATVSADYVLRRGRAGASCPGDPTRVRQVERKEFGEVAPAVFAAARRRRAGQMDRDASWWNRVLGRDG